MEMRKLKTFQVLAECLNFTEAGKKLNFTQPAITAQIQSLEKELNQLLFYRVGKKNYLTSAGKLLKNYTDQIFQTVEEMEKALADLQKPYVHLEIATSEYYCTNYFPFLISESYKKHSDIHVNLISCPSDKVIRGVKNNQFDVGVIAGQVLQSGIKNIILEEEELLLVVAKHIYDQYSTNQILDKFPFIRFQIEGYFQEIINKFIHQSNFSPTRTIEFGSEEAIKRAILNGIGYGLLSSSMIKQNIEQEELIPIILTDKKSTFQTSLIYLEKKEEMDALKSFRELVQLLWKKSHEEA